MSGLLDIRVGDEESCVKAVQCAFAEVQFHWLPAMVGEQAPTWRDAMRETYLFADIQDMNTQFVGGVPMFLLGWPSSGPVVTGERELVVASLLQELQPVRSHWEAQWA